MYRRILGPVYDNENKKWRIIINKEIYASVEIPTVIETVRLNRLCWFGHVQRIEGNRIPKRVLYMNLGTRRKRGRPRNRWQDEVWEDGRIVGGEWWQEKLYNREKWKTLLRTARKLRIQHMALEWMNGWMNELSKFQRISWLKSCAPRHDNLCGSKNMNNIRHNFKFGDRWKRHMSLTLWLIYPQYWLVRRQGEIQRQCP